jgi:hypothetical protein
MWVIESGTTDRWFEATLTQKAAIDIFMAHYKGYGYEFGPELGWGKEYVLFREGPFQCAVIWSCHHWPKTGHQHGMCPHLTIQNMKTGKVRLVRETKEYELKTIQKIDITNTKRQIANLRSDCPQCGMEKLI